MPFLYTLVSVDSNGSLITAVFRKPTHMDQNLCWDSHHSIINKYSVYNSLTHRVWTVCSDQQLLGHKYQHIKNALSRCKYTDWVFHRLQTKMDYKLSLQHYNNPHNPHRDTSTNGDIFIVVPYSKGPSNTNSAFNTTATPIYTGTQKRTSS